ncbi:hypothetical protein ACPOL_3282 [Acidisarcina polymorpha]|uniref:Uncharacterized protein n=1 Tax=Acidisarcina polymorpha TaxID=2211140 RepID=A0A2Z5G1Q0_9BACT|nr:hypothetical protein [Acidisarcina polymorpha]AXC12575.1 hypothetical protein ACPOL_3282 [Acidisarcina polymorpha]
MLVLTPVLAHSQAKGDPLNDAEVDQVREVADQPVERIKLYMKFISQRTDAIQELVGDTKTQNTATKLHNLLEEYTRLVDELQDNLDSYDSTHSDVRKALKELVPASEKWLIALSKPPADQSYDFSRKTAMEAGQSLAEQAKKLQADQIKWFAEHKKDKEKDGGEASAPK